MNNKYHHEENQPAWITLFMYLMTPELMFFRPLNSHGFTVCDMFHCLCHGLTVGFSFLMVLQNLIGFCLKKLTLLWKNKHRHHIQMQLKNCMIKNNMISMISSMIKNNKTCSRSSLSLSWALMFILLVKTYIVNPFHWKPPSDLLKRAKNFTTEYNRQHFSKKILRPWSSFP